MTSTTNLPDPRAPEPPRATHEHFRPAGLASVRFIRVQRETRPLTSYTNGYSLVSIYDGCFEDWYRGRVRTRNAGDLKLKEPGEVHRDLRVHAPFTLQVAIVEPEVVQEAAAALGLRSPVHFLAEPRRDPAAARQRTFALHDAVLDAGADRFLAETRVAEALAEVLATYAEGPRPSHEDRAPRPVRRAREYLHGALEKKVTLDELAAHAGMDKYHLVRAFRQAVGVPPYEYLTHLRVARACDLLARGTPPREAAQAIGLYDESQLHRHFRRIVRTTPGRYAAKVATALTTARHRGHGPSTAAAR
ncbi:helix-turn-helix transcriptional regulator [Sorangium sp. So ce134]